MQLLVDLKEKKRYWNLKDKEPDLSLCVSEELAFEEAMDLSQTAQ